MKATVIKDVCIGCALCESMCPDVFEMRDNIAVPKSDSIDPKDEACAKQMVKDCPVDAIKVE
jgi:ferredoxin